MIGTSASGKTPPRISTDRQPWSSTRLAEASPPSAEPTVKPQNMVVTRKERRFSGQNSDVSVTEFGMAPPRPSPVRKRQITSSHSDDEYAEARHDNAKKSTQ